MIAVTIKTEPTLEIGPPRELWNRAYFSHEALFTTYDVAPDGRFLMLAVPSSEANSATINVVLDWLAEKTNALRGHTRARPASITFRRPAPPRRQHGIPVCVITALQPGAGRRSRETPASRWGPRKA
jgi:hypothetical protein